MGVHQIHETFGKPSLQLWLTAMFIYWKKHQKKPSWQFKVVPGSQREIVGPYEWILDDYTPLFKFKFYVDEITSPQPKTIASLANLHTGDGSHYLTT